jgi:hypothetical protein
MPAGALAVLAAAIETGPTQRLVEEVVLARHVCSIRPVKAAL